MRKFKYLIKGKVQGVAFRYYTKKLAEELGIYGYVKNLINGDVETVVSGSPENLEVFENFLHTGPPSAKVSYVEKKESDSEIPVSSFEILF